MSAGDPPPKAIVATFWKTKAGGNEPVRVWLRSLAAQERKGIGSDIMRVEMKWPGVRMPLVRPLKHGLWEVRSNLRNRIGRVIFGVDGGKMVLLHGFVKKTQKTPQEDLDLAKERWDEWKKARK